MKKNNKKRIIVVLGMHRSGTSAIARGLQALGVDLGNNLMPPAPDNNDKGFYEDLDINGLNIELLNVLDSDWHALSLIPSSAFDQENLAPFTLRAIALLRAKMGDQIFGFKDPRITRLLPFWQAVFNHLNVSPSYVIAVRHPMSVMQSLQRRDGFDKEKSYYLWLEHVLPTIFETADYDRVFVDFDLLMADPKAQLRRIAQALDLPFSASSSGVKEYMGEFLDEALRHAQFEFEDLHSDSTVPPDVINAYEVLVQLARDEIKIDGPEVAEIFGQLNSRLQSLQPVLNYTTRLERKVAERDAQIANRDKDIVDLRKALVNRDSQIVQFNHALTECNNRISDLESVRAEHKSALALIDLMKRSKSWRLTRPMRFLARLIRYGLTKGDRQRLTQWFRYLQHQLPMLTTAKRPVSFAYHNVFSKIIKAVRCIIQRTGLRRRIAYLLGMTSWPDGDQKISQGFTEEELQTPGTNVDNPFISAIMPVYNACRSDKRYFLGALESVANQSYKNIELIIVDDGSTDESRGVCDNFLSTRSDLRARYFSKKNGGQSSARNYGVKQCNGEYIAFIDQDDEWYRDKLEQVVPWLGHKSIDVLYTDADIIDHEGNVIHRRIHQSLSVGWPHPKKTVEDILFKDIFVMPGLMTIKKETFESIGGFDENMSGYEDDDLFLRLFEKSKIFYLPVSTLKWRLYGENYSFSRRMLTSRSYYWKKLMKNYTDNGTNRTRRHMISLRFFWEFIYRALDQYNAGNELHVGSIDGAREIVPFLPGFPRIMFRVAFLLPHKVIMNAAVLARKAFNGFK